MIVEDVLPKELTDTLDSPKFDDEAGIMIDFADFEEQENVINFSIHYEDGLTPVQHWRLVATEAKVERISRSWTQDINLYKQNPLLLEYTDTYAELYFNGITSSSLELFADICQSFALFVS
jgi:hypothetical protein